MYVCPPVKYLSPELKHCNVGQEFIYVIKYSSTNDEKPCEGENKHFRQTLELYLRKNITEAG